MARTCSRCGAKVKQGIMSAMTRDLGSEFVCDKCKQEIQTELKNLQEAADKVVVTTTHSVDGYRAVRYIGVESVEFVIGTAIFSEISTGFQDFFGQRSTAFESKLQNAKTEAFKALKMIAAKKGANAIVGIDLDYMKFSGNRIGLVLNGTLVRLEPVG